MRRLLRVAALLVATTFAVVAAGAAFYVHRIYLAQLPRVDALLDSLPPSEADPPEVFRRIVLAVDSSSYEFWVARSLLWSFEPEPVRMRDWHLRTAIWTVLLPRRLAEEQMLGLYAHFLPFEGGSGLEYGARRYHGKAPARLSEREVVELLAISRSPSGNSPTKRPERFERAVDRLLQELDAAAAREGATADEPPRIPVDVW